LSGQHVGSTTGYDYATVAYDAATGSKRWVNRHNTPGDGDDIATALGVGPDGSRVFVTGISPGATGTSGYETVAYDAASDEKEGLSRYNGPGDAGEVAYDLAVSPDGSLVS
jgi:hypothetical protein